MQKSSILITGVGGFVGSSLAHRLVREGYSVIGVCSDAEHARPRLPQEVELHECDIRSPDLHRLFQGVRTVFHLAGRSSIAECQQDPVSTMDINVVGTVNVFQAAERAGVHKVVYASSAVLEEPLKRETFYAISKETTERVAQGFIAIGGLAVVGLRYFNIYGPGQEYRGDPPVISRFISALAAGEQPVVFEGYEDIRRDFVYIDDIHDFHLLCINDARVDNRVFRLGSGAQYTTMEIIHVLQKILHTHLEPIVRPRANLDVPSSTLADIADARSVGWEPKTGLEEGLRSLLAHMKLHPPLS